MGYIENKTFPELNVGDTAGLERRLTLEDLRVFAGSSAAMNPEHMTRDFATSDLYHGVITHGMWGTSLIATLIGTELPGPGSRILEEDFTYHHPVQIGDTVSVEVSVREKGSDGSSVLMGCRATNDTGQVVISGTVLVAAPAQKLHQEAADLADADFSGVGKRRQLHRLLGLAQDLEPVTTAVVHPVDEFSLVGAVRAAEQNLIVPVLVGPEAKIRSVAEEHGVDINGYRIVSTEHSHAAAERAVELARDLEVGCLMKGALHTDEFMHPVVQKGSGVRTARRMSHVWVMDVPTYPRPLLITDSALNIFPDLATKVDICQNAINLAQTLGIETPKVAILSATEEVNPVIQSTLDAAALCKMADRGQITGGLLDGPLGFDNAVSEAAARTKHINSAVAGKADILLAPDLESANMIGKQLHYLADAEAAGIVAGARVPLVLTSRADDVFSRIAACAIALLMAEARRKQTKLSS